MREILGVINDTLSETWSCFGICCCGGSGCGNAGDCETCGEKRRTSRTETRQ